MNALAAFLAGLVFGVGLLLSGMADPGKVKGFLDLAGAWDPSLVFVMGGAILVGFFAFRFAGRRARSVLGEPMHLPTTRDIDRRLIAGSVVFGIGWGLAGFCPGPALVSVWQGSTVVFVAAMLVGMLIHRAAERLSQIPRPLASE
jgi:uncharacterized protein